MLFNVKELMMSTTYILELMNSNTSSFNKGHIVRSALLSAEVTSSLYFKDSIKIDAISYSILYMLKDESNDKIINPIILDSPGQIPNIYQVAKLCNFIDYNLHLNNPTSLKEDLIGQLLNLFNNKIELNNLINAVTIAYHKYDYFNVYDENDLLIMLEEILPDKYIEISLSDFCNIIGLFISIVFKNSKHTLNHCLGIAKKMEYICQYYNFDEDEKYKLIIASLLHDIGKISIPASILEKTSKLSVDDYSIIKQHPYYTEKILKPISGFDDITKWACNHHEMLDGSGYPRGMKSTELDFNSRLVCCMDIYQALTEERCYRKSMSHAEAIKIMLSMKKNSQLDNKIVNDISKVFFTA